MNKNNTKITGYGGKVFGTVRGDTYFRSLTDAHFLRKPPGLAISQDVLEQLQALDVKNLCFTHSVTGVQYRATLSHFIQAGFTLERGSGKQVALPLYGWLTTSTGTKQLEPVYVNATPEPKQGAEQLSFGGWK